MKKIYKIMVVYRENGSCFTSPMCEGNYINKRKMLSTIISVVIGVLIVASIAVKVYSSNLDSKYPIPNNSKDIQNNLLNWLNRGDVTLNPKLIEVIHLGKSDTYVSFFRNQTGDLGIATLKEGPNKKLRIINSRHGTGLATYNGVKTNKGNFGIVTGKNPNKQIHSIRVELQNETLQFKVMVPDDSYFITVKKLPKGISSTLFADLYFFDKSNKDITKQIWTN